MQSPFGRTRARDRSRGHGSLRPTLASADFTGLTAGVAALPSGWALTRASVATVQTGTSTVDSTPAVDQARAGRRLDADAIGLVIEETRTSNQKNNRDSSAAGWSAKAAGTTMTYNYAPGVGAVSPDGQQLAARAQIDAAGYAQYQLKTWTAGETWTASCWHRGTTGAVTSQIGIEHCGNPEVTQYACTTAWTRSVKTGVVTVGSGDWLCLQGYAGISGGFAHAYDAMYDLSQFEKGAFATEVMIVGNVATVTRAGERLRFTPGTSIVANGQIRFYAKLMPKGAATDYAINLSVIRLWTDANDATSYVEMNTTTRVMTVSIAGSTNTTAALTWSQFDVLEIWVQAGGSITTAVSYRVNGGATTRPAITGSALGAFAPAGALDVLCDGTTKQFSAWLYNIAFYRSGQSPSWV